MGFSIWHWIVVLIIIFLLSFPIFVPLYYWYVKKNRDSKIYKVARTLRIIFAVLIAITTIVSLFNAQIGSVYESAGMVIGRLFVIYFLWKKWKN